MFALGSLLLLVSFFQVKGGYHNSTFNITTRDGIHLKSYLYLPDPLLFKPPYATIYEKSPYHFDDLLEVDSDYFTALGFAYLGQQCRGTQGSGGEYSFWRTSGNDTIDTIHWWKTEPSVKSWANGNLAVAGISADCIAQYSDLTGVTQSGYWPNGNYTYFADLFYTIETAVLALGSGLGHQTVYQGGAYRQGLISGWLQHQHQDDMITTLWHHEGYDSWWHQLSGVYENQWDIENRTMVNFAGWYDIFSTPNIKTVLAVNSSAYSGARGQQLLFIDPGGHCPMGGILWDKDLYGWEVMLIDVAPILLREIFYHDNHDPNKPFNIHDFIPYNLMFYMLGPNPNGREDEIKSLFWVQSKSFPPIEQNLKYYFDINKDDSSKYSLTTNIPNNSIDTSLTYEFNPNDPVDTLGGNNLIIQPCGPENQIYVERDRSDILQFDSENLTDYLAIVGMIEINLFVSSDSLDTDFTGKVIDLFPDGREMLVQDSIIRMRWRNGSFSLNPELMKKGVIYNVTIDIGYMGYVFQPGHKIRVSISSSNYPRFSVNYNSGLGMLNGTTNQQNAMNTVHFGSTTYPSQLILPKVSLQWLLDRKVTIDDKNKPRNKLLEKAGIDVTELARKLKKKIYNKKLL